MSVKVNYKNIANLLKEQEVLGLKECAYAARKTLVEKTGAGNDFLGWVNWTQEYDKEEYARIKKAAEKIRKDSEVLVVIGIGGSYLGAKAVIEAMKPYFKTEKDVEIIFAGHTLSSTYASQLLKYLENKEFSINVISKSGTTTEPAVAFRLFKELLIKKYGNEEAAKRIYATTDKAKGALRVLATKEGYETFIVPDDIGGRYSWFTAVGLLPIAAAGISIDELMNGAEQARLDACPVPTNLFVSIFRCSRFLKVHSLENGILSVTFFDFRNSFLLPLFFFESGFFFYQFFFFRGKILEEVKLLERLFFMKTAFRHNMAGNNVYSSCQKAFIDNIVKELEHGFCYQFR